MKIKKHKSKRKPIAIQDVRAEYDHASGAVKLIAEHLNGEEVVMIEYIPLIKPLFADETLPADANDYQDYYNDALEEAHLRGLYIAGELE